MNTEQQTPYWLSCPICHEKTDVRVHEDTVLFNFPLHCPHCQKESIVNVLDLKMAVSK